MLLNLKYFGQNLRFFREQAGYTQEALSEKLNITHSHYSKLESGTKTPSLKTAINIANSLAIPLDFLLKDDGWRIFAEYSNTELLKELQQINDDELDLISSVIDIFYKKIKRKK